MTTQSYLAFLSYARRDRDWAHGLHTILERALGSGRVFMDTESIPVGGVWPAEIESALAASRFLIVLVTPDSMASSWVHEELARRQAQEGGLVGIVPVLLIDAPMPAMLGARERGDFRSKVTEAEFREELGKLLGRLDPGARVPDAIEVPPAPLVDLEPDVRDKLVRLIAEPFERMPVIQSAVEAGLKVSKPFGQYPHGAWARFPTPELRANAALVAVRGDDRSHEWGERVVRWLRENYVGVVDDLEARIAELEEGLARVSGTEKAEDSLVHRYLASVAEAHAELVPYFRQRHAGESVLEHVYVELDLEGAFLARQLEEDGKATARTIPKSLDGLLGLGPEQHSWVTQRWAVRGDPGAGKTTLLRHLARRLAKGEVSKLTGLVPIYEPLPRLLRTRGSLLEQLEERHSKGPGSAQGLAAALDDLGQEGQLVVLLDSFDEVPQEDRDTAFEVIREISLRWPRSIVVVASRVIGYVKPSTQFVELTIQKLDTSRRRDFLARWLSDGEGPDYQAAERAMTWLESNGTLAELSRTPLYLTLLGTLFANPQGAKGELATTRTELFEQVFDLLLEGRHRSFDGRPEPFPRRIAVQKLLAELALSLTEDGLVREDVGRLEDRLYRERFKPLRENLATHDELYDMRSLLELVADRTSILGPHDGKENDWRFWHKSFSEALTAEALAVRLESDGVDACFDVVPRSHEGESPDGLHDRGRWVEPFALLAARSKERDSIVRALLKRDRTFGLRALATVEGAGVEVLREALELTDDWEERRDVITRVPELLGDPERSVWLLEQIARSTRDGNDLYYIDRTLREIGKQGGSVEASARRAVEHLFDHMPVPGDVFRLTTSAGIEDGFARIPAGEFWMGSSEEEEGRMDDEGPRHRVRFEQDFWIAKAPVTRAQYARFDPSRTYSEEEAQLPVVDVTWYEASMYARWIGGRLPTEAQWEYACRAGSSTRYWAGDSEQDLERVGWYAENSGGSTHPVAGKPSNPWGLYDVSGNVWEWIQDSWSEDYSESREAHPAAYEDPHAEFRVLRGGSFNNSAGGARSACRGGAHPSLRLFDIGFRPARASRPGDLTSSPPAVEGSDSSGE